MIKQNERAPNSDCVHVNDIIYRDPSIDSANNALQKKEVEVNFHRTKWVKNNNNEINIISRFDSTNTRFSIASFRKYKRHHHNIEGN